MFSVPGAPSEGIVTVLALDHLRIETSDFDPPLENVAGACDLFSINLKVYAPSMALPDKADADT